ncbi:hypothetical protein C8Q74DRAFT_1205493 [Fomes fomentarius]|nr:hypothetical protein C8Q74DRAFT_1205493 [Fomes fomentarius]
MSASCHVLVVLPLIASNLHTTSTKRQYGLAGIRGEHSSPGPTRPPQWLREHPAITARGILFQIPIKPYCVWSTDSFYGVPYAVKIVKHDSEEAEIYDLLHRLDPVSPNHTLPCDVVHGERTILIMPLLKTVLHGSSARSYLAHLSRMLDFFREVLEGLDFLHRLHIAHMDIYDGQFLVGTQANVDVTIHKQIQPGKVYIIDFGSSKRLEKGPGYQHALELPETNCKPPLHMSRFDPYSWDIYCTGIFFKSLAERVYRKQPVPWILRRYTHWLIGEEHGCTAVCHCRPSARRAHQVLSVLCWAVSLWEYCTMPVKLIGSVFMPRIRTV